MTCCCLPLSFQRVVLALQLTCCCGTVSEHEHHKTELMCSNPPTGYAEILISFTQIEGSICSLRPSMNERVVLMVFVSVRLVSHCTAVRTMQTDAVCTRLAWWQLLFMFFILSCSDSKLVRFSVTTLCFWVSYKWNCKKYARHLIQTNRRETMMSLMLNCICSVAALYLLIFCVCLKALVCVWVSKALPVAWHPLMV